VSQKELAYIFRNIRNGELAEDLLPRFGLKKEIQLKGLILLLRDEGYNIDVITDEDGKVHVFKKVVYRTKPKLKEKLEDLELIEFGVISDTHMGATIEQLHLINDFYQKAYERGITRILHCGDVVDGDYRQCRPGHPYALFAEGFTEQYQNVVEYYPKIEGIETYFVTGSHDETHMNNGGADMGIILSELRNDLHYLGHDSAIFMAGKRRNVPISIDHPGGGVAKAHSYKTQEALNKLDPGTKPKIYLQGHFHKSYYMMYRNVHAFLVPCITGLSGFMAKNKLKNIMGGIFIYAYVNKKGEIQYLDFERIIYPQSMEIKDAYKKRKKLEIKLC